MTLDDLAAVAAVFPTGVPVSLTTPSSSDGLLPARVYVSELGLGALGAEDPAKLAGELALRVVRDNLPTIEQQGPDALVIMVQGYADGYSNPSVQACGLRRSGETYVWRFEGGVLKHQGLAKNSLNPFPLWPEEQLFQSTNSPMHWGATVPQAVVTQNKLRPAGELRWPAPNGGGKGRR